MMNSKNQLLIVLCLLAALQTQAQHSYTQTLRVINKKIAAAYRHHDTVALLRIYADEAVSMPEYHLTLFGKKAIGNYLLKWMDSARVNSYSRRMHDITKVGNYLLETGTFSNKFSLGKKAIDYDGKYLNIWQMKPGGGLQLISEITGTVLLPRPMADQTRTAIQSMNDKVAELVVRRRGQDFAKYYTEDAIYMPYYMPMLIGKAAIDAYYRAHEDPKEGIDAVHIGATRIIDIGDYVLVDGYYKVDWRGGNAHGTVTGKNINVWKRDRDGNLLLFRQMTVHD